MENKRSSYQASRMLIMLGLFFIPFILFAQQKQIIKGRVVDSTTKEGLIGVVVAEKGTTNGTSTDVDGNFTLNASSNSTITISYIGYNNLSLSANADLSNILLTPSTNLLDEVVVVGYGVQKKSLVTGAISSLSAEDLERPGMMRADEALQGKTAGVTVMANSGQPGENVSIRIRGIGTNKNASPLYIVDGQSMDDISFLNPRDIQSMEVLKDAASSAIYGARGANGVIMITTKKGKVGERMSITYDFSYGVQNLAKKMDLLNAEQYMMIQNEAAFNSNMALPFSKTDMADIAKIGKGTDWQEEILYRNAPVVNHQISLAGGAEKSVYNVSASILDQDGIFAKGKSNYKRITFHESTDHFYFDNKFKVGQSVIITKVDKKGIDPNSTFSGPTVAAINMDPLTPVYNADGTFAESKYVAQEVVNPVARIEYSHGSNKFTRILGNAYADLTLFKVLNLRSSLSAELNFSEDWGYSPYFRLNSSVQNLVPKVNKSTSEYSILMYENVLSYDETFNKHSLKLMAGNTVRQGKGSNLGGSKGGLLIDEADYAYLDLAKDEKSAQAWGGAWHDALVSYFGRANYSFDDRYMFTATFRADGSTRFGKNNRFGYFPSVSAGWNIINEDFMKDFKNLDYLKLRASWGQNGNEKIGDWQFLPTISTGARGYTFNDIIYSGASPAKVANPDLKWETSEQTNIGLDVRMFKKFNASVDYYIKKTKDLLVVAPIPSYVGAPAAYSNAGSVKNEGIEFVLGYADSKGDFGWNVDFNISYNKNEVTEVGNSEGWIGGAAAGTAMTNVTRMEKGHPISYFWGYKSDGLFQNAEEVNNYKNSEGKLILPEAQAGDIRFLDLNGDGKIDEKDRTDIGDPNPSIVSGLTLGLSWKNFDVSAFFSGMFGNKIFNATRRWDLPMSNYQTSVLDRWYAEGTSNSYPRVTTTDPNKNYSRPSDFFLENGSFVRLKNLTVGYSTDKLKKFYLQKVRLYMAVSNLMTFTGYSGLDPEIGNKDWVLSSGIDFGVYPQPRTFTFGVNITL